MINRLCLPRSLSLCFETICTFQAVNDFMATLNSVTQLKMDVTVLTASICLYFLQDLIKLALFMFHRHLGLVGNFNPIILKECLHVLFRILPWLLTETVIAMAKDNGYSFPRKFLQHCQYALAQLRIGWPSACEGWVEQLVGDNVFVAKLKHMTKETKNHYLRLQHLDAFYGLQVQRRIR